MRAAGRAVEPAVVERIVRQVLERLGPELAGRDEASAADRLLVFVVEAEQGDAALPALREALEAAGKRVGARVLAAHAEPLVHAQRS
ncbi:MAG: hypothetical protein HY561_12810 [Gemmatimonadetes bacterium]|nr:hypothetical protein [Gemmatimonadota bacterium]